MATDYKGKLNTEKANLEEELAQIARFNSETGNWEATPDQDMMGEIDDNDAADRFEDFEERSSMVATLQARLDDINGALKKVDTKKFGLCDICGKEIEKARLEANPAAHTCKAHMNQG